MKMTTIPIKGMHCKACEILIGEKLQEIKNITKAKVSLKEKSAEIYSKTPLDMALVEDAIREAGYEIGEEESKAWFSKNIKDYSDLGLAFLAMAVLYFIGSGLGFFNINIGNGSPSSLLIVLLVGLTAGVSTCMAMVGGLVLGISARHADKHPEATAFQKFRPHLYFNLGRISSYFLLGGFIGSIGKVFQFSSSMLGVLTIGVGLVMLLMGLKLIEIFPKLSNANFSLPSGISKFLGLKKHHDKEYSHLNSIIVGALTFFLPCGFTQAMQLYAMSTGNFLSGALIMGVFALGTAPGLLSIGGLTSLIKGSFAKMFFKFAGLVVIFLSLFNISNGLNLTGWSLNPGTSSSTVGQATNVTTENGVQIAKMTQTSSGYSPRKFIVQKGIPVKWVIDAQDLNSCSSGISLPKFNITKNLSLGENIIEFTPTETGNVTFTCLMGMYPGAFTVVDSATVSSAASGSKVASAGSTAPSASSRNFETPADSFKDKVTQNTVASTATGVAAPAATPSAPAVQLIKTAYAAGRDIQPNEFTVKAGSPVKFLVDVQDNGSGCMSTIMIPGLHNTPEYLEAGQVISMEFTPAEKGSFPITCAMGVQRGTLNVI